MSKKIIKKIPLETLQNAHQKLDEIENLLKPYLISLEADERHALIKMEEESYRFLELSYRLTVDCPELFPAFMKAAVFKEEYSAANELSGFFKKMDDLKNKIRDTEMLAGSHALEYAFAFYDTVKIAARRDIPGSGVIDEELKSRLPSRSRRYQKRNGGNCSTAEL
jgi:hypothetical protein